MADDQRVALVTGATRGIGAAIADRLAADGHSVVGTATSAAGAATVAERLGEGRGIELRIDDDESVASALERISSAFGAPSILVNNAGINRDNLLMRMSAEQWSSVIDTNLSGLYRVVKPLLRSMMRARWGRIISISSVVGRMGNAGQVNYAASKAGIEGFTRALALEVRSRGITVNAVAPGFIETDMTDELNEEMRAAMIEKIALARMGTGAEVAHAVAFLATEGAGYITGETLQVNGGIYQN